VDGTDSDLYPVADFGFSSVEPWFLVPQSWLQTFVASPSFDVVELEVIHIARRNLDLLHLVLVMRNKFHISEILLFFRIILIIVILYDSHSH